MIRKYSNNDKSKTIHLLKQNTPEYFAPSEEVDFEKYLENEIEDDNLTEAEQDFDLQNSELEPS